MAPTRLLFLIADTGGGHRASATAVAQRLADAHPGEFEPHIVDPFAETSPRLISGTANLYEPIIRHVPWFWGALYHSTNSRAGVRILGATALRLVEPGLVRLLQEGSFAAVVSFHPLLNDPAARALASRGGSRPPFITVITDLVDVHRSWTAGNPDAIVHGSGAAEMACRRAGIPIERCHHLGLAVSPSFAEPEAADRLALRGKLGIAPDAFSVVLCGGAMGSGGLVAQAAALMAAALPIELTVICGRNSAAPRALRKLTASSGRPLRVEGFVDNMDEWLRASDLLVTKAGPNAIAEAMCAGIPVLLSSHVPGQERGNVDWVREMGVGLHVPHPPELVAAVRRLSTPGSEELCAMKDAVRRAARPDATAAIADLVVSFARTGG